MRAIRRLYFYLVAFISVEVVIWGVISLLRTLFLAQATGGAANILAGGLAAVLVGLPIFLLHWTVAQRDAAREEEESASRERALFLYGVRLAVWVPMVQSLIGLLNEGLLVTLFSARPDLALIGPNQPWSDHAVALAVNAIAWAYFEQVLRRNWQTEASRQNLIEVRRLARYLWMLYTLGLTVFGVQYVLRSTFFNPQVVNDLNTTWLSGGISLALVGAPLWTRTWLVIGRAVRQGEAGERRSLLRLIVLYLLAIGGALVTLISAGNLLAALLRWVLGTATTLGDFLSTNHASLAALPSFGALWAYFGRQLRAQIQSERDPLWQDGLRRIYRYVLSFLGNLATFLGLVGLLTTLAELLLGRPVGLAGVRNPLANSLAALAVGLPVWLWAWGPVQAESRALTEAGSHARRSLLRRAYLYLAVFLTVIGAMFTAGSLLYGVIGRLLGNPAPGFALAVLSQALTLAALLVWLVYHLRVLRGDGALAERALAARYAAFPALILQSGDGALATDIAQVLRSETPQLPVAIHPVETGVPPEDLSAARVVVIPASLALAPPEALRLWLQEYPGKRVVVPGSSGETVWAGVPDRSPAESAREAARAVRQLAEGETVRGAPPTNPWVIVGYALAGLFALQVAALLLAVVISFVD